MKNKSFRRILIHDLSMGFSHNKPKYLLSILLFSLLCVMFFNGTQSLQLSDQIQSRASFMDCCISIFKGMDVYIPSSENIFQIPIEWLTIQVMVSLLILSYPTQDLYMYGTQILTRTNQKAMWWLSKCIWNIVTTICFYLVGIGTIFVFTVFYGEVSLVPTAKISELMNQLPIQSYDQSKLLIAVFILPLVTSIALSLMQMTMAFILTPIYSYLIIVCISVASAYFYTPVLIGNFSMLMRNEVIFSSGINSFWAMIICLSLIIISTVIGCFYFKNYDILKKN